MQYAFPNIVFTIFLILKLTNNIDWSWWWVTAPLWSGLAAAISIFAFVFLCAFLAEIWKIAFKQ